MHLKFAPIDCAILALLQLLQPVGASRLIDEAKNVKQLAVLKGDALHTHLERLQTDGYIFLADENRLIASPRAYFLIERCLSNRSRDKARLLNLNKQRFA